MARMDPDDRKTWPAEVADFVRRAAGVVRGTVRRNHGIMAPEAEEQFLALLRGSTIRAYHCTRLLEHEFASIRAQGLRRLTAELVHERIDRALDCKAITAAEAEHFRSAHAFALGAQKNREGKVCLFSYRQTLDAAHHVEDLLGIWGGEDFQGDIPATQVAAIWTPGHPEYDRHRDLPRR